MDRPSLDSYLGALESEELLALNADLTALREHPGWARYLELLEVQRQKSMYQMVHRPMRDAAAYAHAGGYVKGLEHAGGAIVDKVASTTRDVVAQLEREDREDDG